MRDRGKIAIGFFLVSLLAPISSWAQTLPGAVAIGDSGKGKLLTDTHGMTLYEFDLDKSGQSNCFDKCLVLWPLFKAPDDAMATGSLTIVTRPDGARQWAWQGHPLYYSNKDAAPGDINGDGVRDSWHVIKP